VKGYLEFFKDHHKNQGEERKAKKHWCQTKDSMAAHAIKL
jgi:hypothetical protein